MQPDNEQKQQVKLLSFENIIFQIKDILKNALSAAKELFIILLPVSIIIQILLAFDIIKYVAIPLEPIMKFIGLPAEMGIVWAFVMVNNIYSGIIVLFALLPDVSLTTAQATVLGIIILVAHTLPVELSIAKRAGTGFMFQLLWRFISAIILGFIMFKVFDHFQILQEPANFMFPVDTAKPAEFSLMNWGMEELSRYGYIFGIILCLITLMKFLKFIKIIDLMNTLFSGILEILGISHKASVLTVVGMTLGLSYGGGLIINEAKKGELIRQNVFYSMSLLGICHSLIEDTLLMVAIGGEFHSLLWSRMIFAFIMVALLVKITRKIPEHLGDKYLWGKEATVNADDHKKKKIPI
jgi:hypothetical protein